MGNKEKGTSDFRSEVSTIYKLFRSLRRKKKKKNKRKAATNRPPRT